MFTTLSSIHLLFPPLLPLFLLLLGYTLWWKRRLLPPGPTPLPLFGNVLKLESLAPGYAAFQEWSKQYGPVFTYWIGEVPVVAFTDYRLIRETFIRDGEAFAGRDHLNAGFVHLSAFSQGVHGVVRSEGEEWRVLRRFSMRTLHDLGMGRQPLEKLILNEVHSMSQSIYEAIDKGVDEHDLMHLIDVATGSIITQMMFGYNFRKEGTIPLFTELRQTMLEEVEMVAQPLCKLCLVMPWLRHFPPFASAFAKFDSNISKQFTFFDAQIERIVCQRRQAERRVPTDSNGENEAPSNYVEAFLAEMEKVKGSELEQYFSFAALRSLCFELYGAGQETTGSTLNFIILYLLLDQRVQAKLQEELDTFYEARLHNGVEDEDRPVRMSDKALLPYTNAVIMESQRLCNLVPQNLLHRTTRDVSLLGGRYLLPKGTRVVPQISFVLFDEQHFAEPLRFLPERFLNEDGNSLKKCDELVPFSVGPRRCMGEALARMELFLVTANLFRRFKIIPIDVDSSPSLDKVNGLTISPVRYSCRMRRRL